MNAKLAELYAKAAATPSDINEHLPVFLAMIDEIGALRVLELGVRDGVSTLAWLHGLHGKGHLWSVDVELPGPNSPLRELGSVPHWTFILGRDETQVVRTALPNAFDILFIDTSHTYEQTTYELRAYGPRVRPGGRIVLHDTGLPDVHRAMIEYAQSRNARWTNRTNCYGLGIIEV